MLDTSIAIHLRDGEPIIRARIEEADDTLVFSIITVVELEAGFLDGEAELRRARMSALLETIDYRPFDSRDAAAYGRIIAQTGYSRRKVLDRMIAAQALVDGATLVTRNGDDFRDIPGLTLLEW
ncbi:MAG: PIN domain-containing protein [Candidatus Brevundimonas colombiensis]|uniref:Ribonuclease VapC n=1 Tax=Candidatus Brevundimonas colombiensis TaxID=3121376 RepID=A0AAJ5X316_9CAUL|nr:PIN domain-containing protein [Brevundimonas sp.]WEK40168.1 MAG: PIN domain-containing protein [Brevundimonas sp.]